MLRLIGLGEFSDLAKWQEKVHTFVLNEVICKACNQCRDIDLCKDKDRATVNDVYVLMSKKKKYTILAPLNCTKIVQIIVFYFFSGPFGYVHSVTFIMRMKKLKSVFWMPFTERLCHTHYKICDVRDAKR